MRLWTGKEKSWSFTKPGGTYWRAVRRYLSISASSGVIDLTLGDELLPRVASSKEDDKHETLIVSVGVRWSFHFGYDTDYYDGHWHTLSFGPFFLTWLT